MHTPNSQPILVSVDFSPESKAALLFASALSEQEGRPLVVLHVIHDDGGDNGPYRRTTEKSVMLPMHEIAEQLIRQPMADNSAAWQLSALPNLGNTSVRTASGLDFPDLYLTEIDLTQSMVERPVDRDDVVGG